jgi:hypothetical protein
MLVTVLTRRRGARGSRPRRGGVARVFAEVTRLAPERTLDPVGDVGVPPVQDLAEQVGQQVDDLLRHPVFGCRRGVLLDRDRS